MSTTWGFARTPPPLLGIVGKRPPVEPPDPDPGVEVDPPVAPVVEPPLVVPALFTASLLRLGEPSSLTKFGPQASRASDGIRREVSLSMSPSSAAVVPVASGTEQGGTRI
jgi:hypothetical protein